MRKPEIQAIYAVRYRPICGTSGRWLYLGFIARAATHKLRIAESHEIESKGPRSSTTTVVLSRDSPATGSGKDYAMRLARVNWSACWNRVTSSICATPSSSPDLEDGPLALLLLARIKSACAHRTGRLATDPALLWRRPCVAGYRRSVSPSRTRSRASAMSRPRGRSRAINSSPISVRLYSTRGGMTG